MKKNVAISQSTKNTKQLHTTGAAAAAAADLLIMVLLLQGRCWPCPCAGLLAIAYADLFFVAVRKCSTRSEPKQTNVDRTTRWSQSPLFIYLYLIIVVHTIAVGNVVKHSEVYGVEAGACFAVCFAVLEVALGGK